MEIFLYRSETFEDLKTVVFVFDGYEKKYWLEVEKGRRYEINFSLMHDIANIDSNAPRKHYGPWPDKKTNEYRAGQQLIVSKEVCAEAIRMATTVQ